MLFPRLNIGDKQVIFKEATLSTMIDIAKINARKREHQLTQLINAILDDPDAGYRLTVQQRYFCLLQYIGAQSDNDMALEVNVSNFLVNDTDKSFKLSTKINGVEVRQLNGAEIEVLENITAEYSDWITGAMCLQIGNKAMPAIPAMKDSEQIRQEIMLRHSMIKALPISEFNALYDTYLEAENELTSLVSIGLDEDGVVLYPRGTEDAPCRFRSSTAFGGSAKFLYQSLVEYRTTDE